MMFLCPLILLLGACTEAAKRPIVQSAPVADAFELLPGVIVDPERRGVCEVCRGGACELPEHKPSPRHD